jgi:hypothetical protein
MCTVSWIHQEDGYHLFCNRDEKRSRLPSLAPVREWIDGVSVVAPRDGDFGGTWIAANGHGVTVCLLNGASDSPLRFRESRGKLVLRLASARTAREVCERAWRFNLGAYAPFTVVALEPGEPAAIVEWTGDEKAILLNGDYCMPLASSSQDQLGVQHWRLREFEQLRALGAPLDAGVLRIFHESHLGPSGAADAYSVCMHRPDAATVSFSSVTVSSEEVRFVYSPGAPCQQRPCVSTGLALAA